MNVGVAFVGTVGVNTTRRAKRHDSVVEAWIFRVARWILALDLRAIAASTVSADSRDAWRA